MVPAGFGGVTVYRVLKKNKEQLWYYRQCKPKLTSLLKENETLKRVNEELKKVIEELESKIKDIKAETAEEVTNAVLDKVDERFTNFEKMLKEREAYLVDKAAEETVNRTEEDEEKEKRKTNLVLYNVKGSGKEVATERQAEDTKNFPKRFGPSATKFHS